MMSLDGISMALDMVVCPVEDVVYKVLRRIYIAEKGVQLLSSSPSDIKFNMLLI